LRAGSAGIALGSAWYRAGAVGAHPGSLGRISGCPRSHLAKVVPALGAVEDAVLHPGPAAWTGALVEEVAGDRPPADEHHPADHDRQDGAGVPQAAERFVEEAGDDRHRARKSSLDMSCQVSRPPSVLKAGSGRTPRFGLRHLLLRRGNCINLALLVDDEPPQIQSPADPVRHPGPLSLEGRRVRHC
jgi:hypothetical protein